MIGSNLAFFPDIVTLWPAKIPKNLIQVFVLILRVKTVFVLIRLISHTFMEKNTSGQLCEFFFKIVTYWPYMSLFLVDYR